MAKAENIPIIIGNMYIPSCSLEMHLSYAQTDNAKYEYRKIVNNKKQNRIGVTLKSGIKDENWDYISVQQLSYLAGKFETYKKSLQDLVKYIKKRKYKPQNGNCTTSNLVIFLKLYKPLFYIL